ncbi:MAG TPA: DUF885 family protein [Pyrinomonadaceae bacterium]|jgi:uncharacterized protein (DUF885 family)
MKRKLFAPLLALVVFTSTFCFNCETNAAATPMPQQRARLTRGTLPQRRTSAAATAATTRDRDARLAAIASRYLEGYYEFNPTRATALGLHQHDASLESRSRESVAREVRRLRATLAELTRLPEWRLSTDARYDYLVLQSHARAQLLELEETRMWQRDANLYNRLAASGVDNILKRNYAPVEQRLDALLARQRQIPRLLEEARANLDAPPRIYTEMALAEVRGSIDYFTRVVPQMFQRAGGGRLSAERRNQFDAANDAVIVALRSFAEWLERDLLPRSNGDFAIGAETFRRKLLYEEMIDAAPAQLIREGEKELRRTQEEMRRLAEEIARGEGVAAALRLLGREHPTAGGLVGETRAELDRIRAFVRTQQILTPPTRENLSVAETPEYARATSFASMDAPGAFERVATEAFYYVTPPDSSWNERRRNEHLGFYNRYALPVISIHEVYPGHYYQLLAARNSSSRVRAVLGSASFIEGWAHYCEQMMLDEGFGGNNPKLRLAQLNLALLRLCRYLVGLRMHTEGMSYEAGVEFFMREGYQARVNAEREARRGTVDPTYLVYTLGKMEILKLREEWRAELGASFRLGEFHDRLLSYGSPPIKIIRMALVGDAGRVSGTTSPAVDARDDALNAVDFSLLAQGVLSAHEGGRAVELVTDEDEWRRVWLVIGEERPRPDINFNTRAVVVVYQGQQTTGGYSISIDKIRRDGTTLAVYPSERRPASEDRTTQAVTSPFVAVSIPRPASATTVRLDDAAARGVEQKPSIRKGNVTPPRKRRPRRRS